MKTSRLTLAAAVLILSTPLAALSETVTFGTALSGLGEPTPASLDGSGLAVVTINGTSVSFSLLVKGISTPTGAHIHKGAAGVSGPVVISFNAPVFTNGYATGTTTAAAVDVADLLENPTNYYVNVHTVEFPAGALRGQLGPIPQPTATFVTALTGAGEAPSIGNPDGGGVATVTVSGTTVSFTLMVQGIPTPPTFAHIHRGLLGGSGPVVVDFKAPQWNHGVATGIVTTTPALASEILSNPSGFYVNVHTPESPGGSLRGVLNAGLPTTRFFPTVVKATGLNGTYFVSDLRIVNTTGTTANVVVDFFAAADSASGPSATTTVTVAPNNQSVINDVLGTLFNTSGSGSLRLTSNVPVAVTSRVLNDQRSTSAGTNGLLVPAAILTEAPVNGTLPLLSNASESDRAAGLGFRTSVGYFNPTANSVTAKFTAKKNDGTVISSTVTVPISGFARVQLPVFDLISTVLGTDRAQADFFVTYSVDGPLFVYSTVADNKTGSGVYAAGVNPR